MSKFKWKSYKLTPAEKLKIQEQRHSDAEVLRRNNRLLLKTEVLTHYGNGKLACVKCGFDDIRALSIDHIKGNGAEERKRLGASRLYNYLRERNYPRGYQTLCMNCQWIKKAKNGEYRQSPRKAFYKRWLTRIFPLFKS